jgi:predicted DNA-binding transcriptional regulator YafY
MLPIVQDAVARDRKLSITYCKPNGDRSERTVDPLGLVVKGSAWYLVANTPSGMRTFRVSRIERATPLMKPARRPRDFNLAKHWSEATRQLTASWTSYPATLRLDARSARWMRGWHSAHEIGTPDEHGRITLVLEFDSEHEAAFVVLGLGTSVQVVEPEALRDRVRREAAAIVAAAN